MVESVLVFLKALEELDADEIHGRSIDPRQRRASRPTTLLNFMPSVSTL